ncbi:MAG TPA: AI-2E family transporter [Anaerolineae bacterium]|nr:AI-2E family transporter [Anaerolineae bacterium]
MTTPRWSHTTKTWIVVGLAVLLGLAAYAFRDLIPPLVLALVLAYLLKPLVDWLERLTRLPRVWATLSVFLVVILIFSTIPVTVVPVLLDQGTLMFKELQRLLQDLQAWMDETAFLSSSWQILGFRVKLEDLFANLEGTIQDLITPVFSETLGLVKTLASSVLWVVTILLTSFWIVKDAAHFRSSLDRLAPPGYAGELKSLRQAVSSVWRQFFRGQLLLGLVVGLAVGICTSIVGLPNAGLMGLIAGILEAIPNFGATIAAVPAILTALLRGSQWLPISNFGFALLIAGIYLVIQQLENNLLVPRIMGGRLQLHPVIIMVGLLAGGILFGVVGIFVAAPVVGTLAVLLRYVHAKLLDRDPFPVEVKVSPQDLFPDKLDAFLFDLDGTLADTDDKAVGRLARRLSRLRWLLPERNPEVAARKLVMAADRPVTLILSLLNHVRLDDNVVGLAGRLYTLRAIRPLSALRPVPGTADLLATLAQTHKLALVTNRSRREATAFLEQQGLTGLFSVVTGREDTWHLKPHPAPIRHTAKRLGVPPERCVMIGDTAADVVSARRAGAKSVGVLCGFGTRRVLEGAKAGQVLETTADLVSWIEPDR